MVEEYREKLKELRIALIRGGVTGVPNSLAAKKSSLPASTNQNYQFEPKAGRDVPGSPNKAGLPRGSKVKPDLQGSRPQQTALEITLGIDFGTRFTKVAAFARQTGEYRVLELGPAKSRLLRSRILYNAAENVFPPDLLPERPKGSVEYLKMHLANPDSVTFGPKVLICGVPRQTAIGALCALYLAGVIRLAMSAARKAFSAQIGPHRRIEWFANVGVPVQYCDGPEISKFREVVSVAWEWKDQTPCSFEVKALVGSYGRSKATITNPEDLSIQVAPELAAALAHFIERPTIAEGMYGFFDIGGGTLDGTAFYLTRTEQGKRLDILAAAVDDVGTMAAARRAVVEMYLKMDSLVEQQIIFDSTTPSLKLPLDDVGDRIQKLFNRVIRLAKMKRPNIEFSDFERPKLKTFAGPAEHPRYPVFVAGGGARSQWYADLFRRTRKDLGLHQVGIGECDVKVVPAPDTFSGDEYPRFVVAIGLTSDRVLFDSFSLPSSIAPPPPLELYRPRLDSPVNKDFV